MDKYVRMDMTAAAPPKVIEAKLIDLESAVNELARLAVSMETQLLPVLRPEGSPRVDTTTNAVTPPRMSNESPMAMSLHNMAAEAGKVAAHLVWLLERLDL